MLGQTSLSDEKTSRSLQVALAQEVASRRSTRVQGLGLATLMLIGVSLCALPLLASHGSADLSHLGPQVVAYFGGLPPRGMRPGRFSEVYDPDGMRRGRFSEMYDPDGRGPELNRPNGPYGYRRAPRNAFSRAQARDTSNRPNRYDPYNYHPQRNGDPNYYYPQPRQNFRGNRPNGLNLERNPKGFYRPGPGLPWAGPNAYSQVQQPPEFPYPPRNGGREPQDASWRRQARAAEREGYYPQRNRYADGYYPPRRGARSDRRSVIGGSFAALLALPAIALLATGDGGGYGGGYYSDYYPQRQVPSAAAIPAPRPPAPAYRPSASASGKGGDFERKMAEQFSRAATLEVKAYEKELPALKSRSAGLEATAEAAEAKAAAMDAKDLAMRAVVAQGDEARLQNKAAQQELEALRLDAKAAAMELRNKQDRY